MSCLLCRTQINSWARNAIKRKTLVDEELWGFIKRTFPQQVESAQAGMDEIDPKEIFPCVAVHQFADPGDIKSEFKYTLDQSNRCNMYYFNHKGQNWW